MLVPSNLAADALVDPPGPISENSEPRTACGTTWPWVRLWGRGFRELRMWALSLEVLASHSEALLGRCLSRVTVSGLGARPRSAQRLRGPGPARVGSCTPHGVQHCPNVRDTQRLLRCRESPAGGSAGWTPPVHRRAAGSVPGQAHTWVAGLIPK